jgi:hypothetical protein
MQASCALSRISPRHTPEPLQKPSVPEPRLPSSSSSGTTHQPEPEPELQLEVEEKTVEETIAERRARRQAILAKYTRAASNGAPDSASSTPGPSSAADPHPPLSALSNPASQPYSSLGTPAPRVPSVEGDANG